MIRIAKFYFDIIASLVTGLWDKLEISTGVSYTMFFFAGLLMITFIKLLKFSFENHGFYTISRYSKKQSKEDSKLSNK